MARFKSKKKPSSKPSDLSRQLSSKELLLAKNQCREAIAEEQSAYNQRILQILEDYCPTNYSVAAFHCMRGKTLFLIASKDCCNSPLPIQCSYLVKAVESLTTAVSLCPDSTYIAYTRATALLRQAAVERNSDLFKAAIHEAERGLGIQEPIDPDEDRLDNSENFGATPDERIQNVRKKLQALILEISNMEEENFLSKHSNNEKSFDLAIQDPAEDSAKGKIQERGTQISSQEPLAKSVDNEGIESLKVEFENLSGENQILRTLLEQTFRRNFELQKIGGGGDESLLMLSGCGQESDDMIVDQTEDQKLSLGNACIEDNSPRREDGQNMKNCDQLMHESDEMHLAVHDKEDGNAAEDRTKHRNVTHSQPQLHGGGLETVEVSESKSDNNVINEKNGSKGKQPPSEDSVVQNPNSYGDSIMGNSFERKSYESYDQIVKESENTKQPTKQDKRNTAKNKESSCTEKRSPFQEDPEDVKKYDQLGAEFVKEHLPEHHDDIYSQHELQAGGSETVETSDSPSVKNTCNESFFTAYEKGLESFQMRLSDIEKDVQTGVQHWELFSTATGKRFNQLEATVGIRLNSIERKSQTIMEHLSYIQTHVFALNDLVASLLSKKASRNRS